MLVCAEAMMFEHNSGQKTISDTNAAGGCCPNRSSKKRVFFAGVPVHIVAAAAFVLSAFLGLPAHAQSAAPVGTQAPAKPLQKQSASPTVVPAQAKPSASSDSQPAAAPAQQLQAGSEQAQSDGSIKVTLQPTQTGDWKKICGKDQGNNKELCFTTRDFGEDANQPVLALAVYDIKGEDKRMIRVLVPPGFLLKPGFRLALDQSPPVTGSFTICLPNGCFAETEINGAFIAQMKKANLLLITMRNPNNNEISFTMPMKDFAKAFDGPATDPKILEEQAQELQKKLEEQARAQAQQQGQGSAGQAPLGQTLPGQLTPSVSSTAPKP